MQISFSPPFIDEAVIAEVMDTLQSGWITTGPKVRMLESLMCGLTRLPQCLAVNSWTSGARLVLKWWGIGPGDEVIVPAYTYAATALVVLHAGAIPVMVDVNEDFVIDPAQCRKAITPRTKAIIPVDFAGWPVDYKEIRKILTEPSILSLFEPSNEKQALLRRPLLVADAAHSLGAMYDNGPAGLQADITIYSLHAVKNITTAEGGVIGLHLPDPFVNEEVYAWMKINSLNGQTKDAFTKAQGGNWRYDIVSDGLKINMPDICAAIGVAQLREYSGKLLPERKRVVRRYCRALEQLPWAQLPPLESGGAESSYHIFPLTIRGITESQRDEMIEKMYSLGVSVNVHFIPLPMLTLFRDKGYSIGAFPCAKEKFSKEMSLPVYPQLTDEQVDYVIFALILAYESAMGKSANG